MLTRECVFKLAHTNQRLKLKISAVSDISVQIHLKPAAHGIPCAKINHL